MPTSTETGPLDGRKDEPKTKAEKTKARLGQYRSEIQVSSRWRAQYERVWLEVLDMFRHKARYSEVSKAAPDCDKVQVNKAFTAIEIMMAATAIEDPYVTVTEIAPHYKLPARMAEEALNAMWYREDFKLSSHDTWKDTLIFGHGWGKAGWAVDKTRFGEDPTAIEEELRAVVQGLRHSADLGSPNEITIDDDFLSPKVRKKLKAKGYRITRDAPVLHRVDPWDVYVPPDATRPWNMRWVCQRTRMTLECARTEHPEWNKQALKDLGTVSDGNAMGLQGRPGRGQQQESAVQWVDIYEYWDIKRGTVAVFAADGEHFLSEPAPMPFKGGHPFVMCRNHEVPGDFYPIGDLEIVTDQQYEINRIRSEMIGTIRKQRTQYLAPESLAKNPTFNKALLENESNVVVGIPDKLFEDLRGQALQPMPRATINSDLYQMDQRVCDDFYEGTGISDYVNGGASRGSTATEAAVANAGQQTRDGWKLTSLERFIEQVARKTLVNAQCFMQTNQWVRLSGRNPDLRGARGEFAQYDRSTIAGEFDYAVDVGSTVRMNPQLRQEQALQLVTAIAPLAQAVPLNMNRLFEHILDAFGVKDPETFLQQGGAGVPLANPNTAPGGPAPVGAGTPPGTEFPTPELQTAQLEGQVGLSLG